MATIDTISVHLKLQDLAFRAGLSSARAATRAFESSVLGSFRRMQEVMGTSLRVGGATAAAGLGFGIKAAIDFESQVGAVRKTTGLAGKDLEGFVDQVKGLARTLPGVSIEDLLGAASEGGRQGMSDAGGLLDYVKAIGMMKVALDDIPIEESASSVGKLASNYQLGMDKVLGLASALNKLDDTSKASARQILQAALQSSQMANALGISADWALALSSGLVEAGMSADTAGTAFSQILRRLSSEQENFAALAGVSAEQYAEALKEGPLAALELVVRRLQDIAGRRGGVSAIGDLVDAKIVDQQQTQALLSLVQSWDQLADRAKVAGEELRTGASILKEVEIAGGLTSKQLGLLWNQIRLAAGALGSKLLPGIKALSAHLGQAFDRLAKWTEGGALSAFQEGLVQTADVIGAAFKDLPGTFDLISKAFDALVARLKLGLLELLDFAKRTIMEYKDGVISGTLDQAVPGRKGLHDLIDNNPIGPAARAMAKQREAVGQPGQGIEGLRKEAEAGASESMTALEQAQKRAAEAADALADAWRRQAEQGKQARERPKASGFDAMRALLGPVGVAGTLIEMARPDPAVQRRALLEGLARSGATAAPAGIGALPGIAGAGEGAGLQIDALDRADARQLREDSGRALVEGLGRIGVLSPATIAGSEAQQEARRGGNISDFEEMLFDPLGQQILDLDLQRYNIGMDLFREGARRSWQGLAEDNQDRIDRLNERRFSVQSGSSEDFAAAIQAGIGKSDDYQKEIRDLNKQMVDLLRDLTREWSQIPNGDPI